MPSQPIAVVLVSVPLAAIVFPLLFGIVALLSLVVSAATGSAGVLDVLLASGGHFLEGDGALLQGAALGLIVVLPGALLMLAIWLRSLRVLASIEPGRLVELYGARLVRTADFEERQVSNVVEELAIAAGIAPPTVHIVDSEAVNAAAVAPADDGALVLVTRGLLERCDRAETQALLASSVAMIANGDARSTFRWLGAAAAVNIAADLLHGPLAAEARARLRMLLPLLRGGTLVGIRDSALAVELLLGPPPSISDTPARGRVDRILLSIPDGLGDVQSRDISRGPALSLAGTRAPDATAAISEDRRPYSSHAIRTVWHAASISRSTARPRMVGRSHASPDFPGRSDELHVR